MKKRSTNFYLLISVLLLAACAGKSKETSITENEEMDVSIVNLTPEQVKTTGIVLGSVEEREIGEMIKVNGILDVPPQQLISISVPLGGFLKSTSLLEGVHVKKGQAIAVIENMDFIQMQQDYIEAVNNAALADANYQRQQQLAQENVNAVKTLQQSKAEFQNWTARRNGLLEKLKVLHLNVAAVERGEISSTISIYAPINGYVTQVNVNIGKFVNPTDILFEIVDTEHLHAELIVFEKDVLKLKIGQKVRFTLANETKERAASIYLIGREIADDRTVQIHCHIDEEDKDLLPGMYLKANVETGGAKVKAIQDAAVVDYLGRKYIFVSTRENSFEMVEVETGRSEGGYTAIVSSSLPESGKEVVVKGAYALLSKLKNAGDDD